MAMTEIRSKLLSAVRSDRNADPFTNSEARTLLDLLDLVGSCHSVKDLRFIGAQEVPVDQNRRSELDIQFELKQKLLPFSFSFTWNRETSEVRDLALQKQN